MDTVAPNDSTLEASVPKHLDWRHWAGAAGGLLVLALLLRGCRGGAEASKNAGGRPVPVTIATAKKGDLTLNLSGLGTVTPLSTVVIKSRVDGILMRVPIQEGQLVQQGQLLAEIDPRPFQVQLMQAEGQLAKDTAAFKNANADLQRLQTLVQQGIISRQQLDTQATTVSQFEAALMSDRAQVESAKLNLTYSRITAPISGRIGLRQVDPGNMVRASDANGLMVITPVQPINVLFTVAADNIQQVLTEQRKGKPLVVEVFDRDMKTRLGAGTLQAIDNQVDLATGTVRMKALFANADGLLFPNQFVNARLQVDTLHDCVLAPTAALQRSPQGAFVYIVKADQTVEQRMVEVQATEGDTSALKGLAHGELVVTDGLEKLRPGSKVSLPSAEGQGKKAKP